MPTTDVPVFLAFLILFDWWDLNRRMVDKERRQLYIKKGHELQ